MTFHHHDRWLSNRVMVIYERRILTLAQDVVHCATEARANMPKHVALGIAVRHTKRSKQLITMFSRMGPCSTYDDIEAMDTSIANEIIANSDIIGVVLPSNISTCVFEQVAADNNDNMKTLLTVTVQPTPQHWSFCFRNRWLPNRVQHCAHSGRMCITRWHSLARTLLESHRSWDSTRCLSEQEHMREQLH